MSMNERIIENDCKEALAPVMRDVLQEIAVKKGFTEKELVEYLRDHLKGPDDEFLISASPIRKAVQGKAVSANSRFFIEWILNRIGEHKAAKKINEFRTNFLKERLQ